MKKLSLFVITAFMLLTFIPMQSNAAMETKAVSVVAAKTVEAAEAKVLITRLDEIKGMNLSTLSSPERKQLRNEVQTIKSQLSDIGGGVYISVGAIILIIILLIILL